MEFDPKQACGLTLDQAEQVFYYMHHRFRMMDVQSWFQENTKFNNLSKDEQDEILDDLAMLVEGRLEDCSNWWDVADDVISKWKGENGYEDEEV